MCKKVHKSMPEDNDLPLENCLLEMHFHKNIRGSERLISEIVSGGYPSKWGLE